MAVSSSTTTVIEQNSPQRPGSFYSPSFGVPRTVWIRTEYAGELAVVGAAVMLSALLSLHEERVEATVDAVRLMGGLFALAGLVLTAAT